MADKRTSTTETLKKKKIIPFMKKCKTLLMRYQTIINDLPASINISVVLLFYLKNTFYSFLEFGIFFFTFAQKFGTFNLEFKFVKKGN